MDNVRFEDLINEIDTAFIETNKKMTGIDFTKCGSDELICKKVLSIMIKLNGSESGFIVMIADYETAYIIAEAINCERPENEVEVHNLFAEFANIFTGRATSQFNKIHIHNQLYINPPLIFMHMMFEKFNGVKFTRSVNYMSHAGIIRLEITISDGLDSRSNDF